MKLCSIYEKKGKEEMDSNVNSLVEENRLLKEKVEMLEKQKLELEGMSLTKDLFDSMLTIFE